MTLSILCYTRTLSSSSFDVVLIRCYFLFFPTCAFAKIRNNIFAATVNTFTWHIQQYYIYFITTLYMIKVTYFHIYLYVLFRD